ncbi:MAG: phosphotriesterase [Dehalococcoidales bacterium]
MEKKLAGKVQTVLGPIDGDELGFTLPHEHLLLDLTVRFQLPDQSVSARVMAEKPVSFDMMGWLRYHLFENRDNLILDHEELAIKEVSRFKIAGGESVVDLTNWGIGRDPHALVRISRATGLHIVMGSGYYTMDSGCAEVLKKKSEDEIFAEIVNDVLVGTDGICAGIIGEIGADSWPLDDIEIKSLRAAVRAQQATGAALNIHPGRLEESPLQILEIIDKAGADLSRVVLDHMDRTAYSFESMVEMAKTGCYLEFDCFSWEGYYPRRYGVFDIPNDATRVNYIIRLIDKGYLNQILISTDICMKHRLVDYGGSGYAHIPENVIPWMRAKGMSEEVINTITVENPKRMLTFIAPQA